MTRLLCALLIALLALAPAVAAQSSDALAVDDVEIAEELNVYGLPQTIARGQLVNNGDMAYTNINLTGQAFDANDAQIGEGFGVLINECGAGLAPDFVLQPGASHPFAVPLEMFEADAEIERLDVSAIGDETAPMSDDERALPDGITQLSEREVVAVEWEDDDTFRYAIGCERDLFTDWTWHRYDLASGRDRRITHPSARNVDEALFERLDLEDPLIAANSQLRFAPIGGQRLVYQNAINEVYTARVDGQFQRRLYTGLNSYSLQGYTWLPENRFMAYYYGAYGDPVIYFTADVDGRFISRAPLRSKPSSIIPGIAADGRRAIIAGTFDDVTGYYFEQLAQNYLELILEAEVPSVNYPPPVPLLNEEGDRATRVYLIRPLDGEARLQCIYRPTDGRNDLIDLAPTPLNLSFDERSWTFLSPDERYIALSANGVHSGLWLIDLQTLPCGGDD
ncbi:MAG: hypothetical protein IT320_14995 [Anaerolineae bacterium]|nr:hypothetical protein [Anaerolineae bacterium]